ncbi:MAG: glutamate--tRNA ligase [Ignavibacteria bacterium]|jgi:glutamyl-tRNA synthetase|nr:glutamate--tRNA ligase [Ignavibacteria bacterium]MCU7504540.1 glutamate--tRNA ligase [Ignavibacteria bacterium]MCU7516622.1 glutamate--tRNA ligase [Ignavibacteria bacterium]
MISEHPRVRFAPSPTGYLHVGGLRTALYNYLFAKNQNGKFILRIEDTDRNRFVEGAVENLINVLKWIGLDYDEGPAKGGNYGPYMQSERLDIYKKYAEELIEKKHAYYCFCSPERLSEVKEEQKQKGLQPKYDKHCLSLSREEIENNIKSGMPYVVRLNVPPDLKVAFDDIVRGHVEFDSNGIDDQVLIKSDGYPTYHMANVVDDHFMKITHVVRGEEWLSSTPKHVLLYDAFGWEKPQFAHLPLLLNPDRSKLSKRQGDVAVEDYRAKGYLKEALLNFVALLGWNAGDDVEFYYLDEMIKKFSLERVNKSGAVFDLAKLHWLNAEHLRKLPDRDLLRLLREELAASKFKNNDYSDEYLLKVITAMKERVSFVREYIEKSPYFFERPETYEENAVKKSWKENTPELLKKLIEAFSKLDSPNKEDYENVLHKTAEELQVGNAKLIHPVRLATSGLSAGPGLFDILVILGKEETIFRLQDALERVKI